MRAFEVTTMRSFSVESSQSLAHNRIDILNRRWAAAMLCLGSVCGFTSIALATLAGNFNSISGFEMKNACFPHNACPSGRSYHAETVSEMVSKPDFPAAKLFFSFTLIGSISLLLSRYPWELKNVYTGGSPTRRLLTAARAVLPPCGMLIVATIPVVPRVARQSTAIKLACSVHSFGATLYVAGYNFLESCTLWILWDRLEHLERILRTICVVSGVLTTISFFMCGTVYSYATELGICCVDQWENTTIAFEEKYHMGNESATDKVVDLLIPKVYGPFVLVNSADGLALLIKKFEFWLEELAGIFVVVSHLLIWKFSKVQHLEVPELLDIHSGPEAPGTREIRGHALAPISGGAILNPAIALGLPFISHGSTVMFGIAYVVAELLGAFIGVRLFEILRAGSEDCCCDIEEYLEMCVPRLSARLLGEGLGTFALVFTFGLNVIGQSEATAWSAAAALISMIYALGKISGGYFNPAVTLAVVLSGRSKCSVGDGFAYCGAQAVGAIAAGVIVAEYRFAAPTAWRPVTLPSWQEYGVATVGIAEGVFTLVLAYVVLACSTVTVLPATKTRQNFYFGLAVGFCVMTGGCTLGSMSGGMLNPAVSVGVVTLNLFQEQSAQARHLLLAFCLKLTAFQCTGGLLAAVVFRLTHPSEYSKAPLLMH
ncbi:Aquaporin-B [Symbiodinium microadriaticum]|uniref:Aquaporin-B n=1 Tax=Symbiodinium microadriaticum TaxID=2951 RepID=A0A1Q9CBL4_SYMMI|nr:Aquaporin-B [Symbiodinium microadriaticum]